MSYGILSRRAVRVFLVISLLPTLLGACGGDSGDAVTDAAPATDSGSPAADAAGPDARSAAEPNVCVETCSGAGSCSPGSVCDGTRCVLPPPAEQSCKLAQDCVPFASSWDGGSSCTTGSQCTSIEECVDVGGTGYCVRKPTQPGTCAARRMEDVQWPDIDGNTVTVCGRSNFACEAQMCVDACTSDDHCNRSSYPSCNLETNRCECEAGSCGSIWGSFCLPSGRCGCESNSHCDRAGFDFCYGDQCGCENATTCDGLAQATLVCEPLP